MNKKYMILIGIILLIIIVPIILTITNKNYMQPITYTDLQKKLDNKETFIFIISQTTCSNCDAYKPKVKKVVNKYKIKTYYLEVDKLTEDDQKKFKAEYAYNGTPTTLFINDGKEKTAVNRIEGNVSTDKLISKLKSNGFINE